VDEAFGTHKGKQRLAHRLADRRDGINPDADEPRLVIDAEPRMSMSVPVRTAISPAASAAASLTSIGGRGGSWGAALDAVELRRRHPGMPGGHSEFMLQLGCRPGLGAPGQRGA
jgi:hypothetical protein